MTILFACPFKFKAFVAACLLGLVALHTCGGGKGDTPGEQEEGRDDDGAEDANQHPQAQVVGEQDLGVPALMTVGRWLWRRGGRRWAGCVVGSGLVPAVGSDAPAPGVHPRCRRAPGSSAVFPAGPRSLGNRRTPLWLRRPPHLACPAPLGLQEEDLGISLTARPGQLPSVAFVERRGNVQIGVPLRPTSAGRPRSGRGGSVRRAADASFPDPPGREQPSRPRAGPRSSRPVPAPGHDYGRE